MLSSTNISKQGITATGGQLNMFLQLPTEVCDPQGTSLYTTDTSRLS